jgi:Ca2+-binding EF-hand superfamily protein
MLFHELPQEAAWVDGHAPDAVPQFAEDILLDAFDAHDLDNDGQLAITELAAVLSDAHRRHAEKWQNATGLEDGEGGGGGGARGRGVDGFELSEQELVMIAADVLGDLDRDASI